MITHFNYPHYLVKISEYYFTEYQCIYVIHFWEEGDCKLIFRYRLKSLYNYK